MPGVLERLQNERASLLDLVDSITAGAEADERDLSESERGLITRHQERIAGEIDPQLDQLEALEITRARVGAANLPPARQQAQPPAVVDDDAPVYRSFAEYARDEMVRRFDSIAQLAGPGSRAQAEERISRAVAHTLTSNVAGLLPAQHLAQIAQVINTARPIVSASRSAPLSAGKLTYPFVVTRPTVGKQATEKTETTSTAMEVEMRNTVAETFLGAGNLSWQAINWSTPDALALWFDLAAEAYAQQTEAAAAADLAATSTTTEVASDDLEGWFAAIAGAAGAVFTTSGAVADTVFADVATGFRLAGLVSQSSPVFVAAGNINLGDASGSVGGLRLVVSRMLAAQTVIIGASQMLLTAETPGAPVELRAVEPSIGGMQVGVIGAFASQVLDPGAFQKLVAPPALP